MRRYVELTYGPWDEEWQRDYFDQHFHPDGCRIVTCDGQDVGLVSTVEGEDEVVLSTLEVLPEVQRRGIGTFVLQSVQQEAFALGKAVTLQVLRVNPARRLYERLGFVVVGETEKHFSMRASQQQQRS
jgi:ribosomal protein S18 acetylase RimI-like enzyme